MSEPLNNLPALNRLLLGSAFALLCLGFIMVTSASMAIAESKAGGNTFYFIIRHGISIVIALCVAVTVYQVPMKAWERSSSALFFVALLMLIAVLIFGDRVNGSKRWLNFGVLNLQPSEIAKIFILIYLSSFIVRKQAEIRRRWMGIIKPIVILFVPAVLLLLEPDFGSLVVLSVAAFVMIFMGGVRISYFLLLMISGSAAFYGILMTQSYRIQRMVAFLDPWGNQFGSAYQLIQSLIAYGRGSWLGQGYGNSVQKLFYLPEAHTDFLIAVLAEEFGLIGVSFVILLFVVLILSVFFIARAAEKRQAYFSAYLGYGLGAMIGIQSLFNMGVSMGLLPTKGLTLPLMSYGGSSLLATCTILAIVLRVHKENKQITDRSNGREKPRRNLKPVIAGRFHVSAQSDMAA
jgi:cell division protein FtsW